MGRIIDRSVISIAAVFILYAVFLGATDSIPAAAILSFIAMCLLKKLSGIIPHENTARHRLHEAYAIIEQLSLTDAETAVSRLTQLINATHPGTNESLRFILRHPSQKTTAEDIAQIYRSLPRCPSFHITSLANADRQAHDLAAKLQNPRIILTDGGKLASLIAKNPDIIPYDPVFFIQPKAAKLIDRLFTAVSHAKYGKCALTGIFMAMLFFISGTSAYLIGSCVLFFISAIAFRCHILSQ